MKNIAVNIFVRLSILIGFVVLLLPLKAFSQEEDEISLISNADVKVILDMIDGATAAGESCETIDNDYKFYFCKTGGSFMEELSKLNSTQTSSSALVRFIEDPITGLITLFVGDLLYMIADANNPTYYALTPADDLLISNRKLLLKYLESTDEYRAAHFKNNGRIRAILKNAFGDDLEIIKTEGKSPLVKFSWVSDAEKRSKTVGIKTFQTVLDDISKIHVSQYKQYLTDYLKNGEEFIHVSSEKMYELKVTNYFSRFERKALLSKQLRHVGYVGIVVGFVLLIWEDYTAAKKKDFAQVEAVTLLSMMNMIKYDHVALRENILETNPRLTKLWADFARSIPLAVSQYKKALKIADMTN